MKRLIPSLFVLLYSLVGLLGNDKASVQARNNELTLIVADHGINQKKVLRAQGAEGLSWVYDELPQAARIAVVMPDRKDFATITTGDLQRSIHEDLKVRVSAARAAGQNAIEIQLVEDIGVLGYVNPNTQKEVDRFGAAAYGAIVDLNRDLVASGLRVRNQAVLGSNGTKVFAANIEAWQLQGKSIWEAVDFFDGRAEAQPVMRAIQAVGPGRVRLFNTRGDLWAADLVGFAKWVASAGLVENYFESIAKVQTNTAIKDLLPGVRVFFLRPQGHQWAHISGMNAAKAFTLSEYQGAAFGHVSVPGVFSGRQLRASQPIPAALPRNVVILPKAEAARIVLWREVAEDLAGVVLTFANELHEKAGGKNAALPYVGLAAQAQTLHLSIRRQVNNAAGAPVVTLSNDLVESLVRFMFGAIDVKQRLKSKTGEGLKRMELLDGIIDIGAFTMHAVSEGTVDAESVKKLQSGTLKIGRDALLSQARKSLEKLHDIAGLERQVRESKAEIESLSVESRALPGRASSAHREIGAKLTELGRALTASESELVARREWVDKSHRGVSAVLMMLDVVPEVAGAVAAQRAAGGKWTPDVVDRYSDAVIMFSTSLLTATFVEKVPVLGFFAGTVRDGAVTAARYVRNTAQREPGHGALYFQWSAAKNQILDQYAAYTVRQRAVGAPAKTFSEYFAGLDLAGAGIRANEVARIDASVRAQNTGVRGGIELDAAATLSGDALPNIAALVFDANSGRLVFVGTKSVTAPLLRERDLAWALQLVFGQRPQDPQFSLDPADPSDLSGPWLKAVYWPSELKGSEFGDAMFTADYLMKQLGLGIAVRPDGHTEQRSLAIPGFASVPELMRNDLQRAGLGSKSEQWARYWIVSDRMIMQQAGDTLRFVEARMAVRAKQQVPDHTSRTGLRDITTAASSIENRWAESFTLRYEAIALQMPEFARITELAKAIALAKWLKQQGAGIDMNWVNDQMRKSEAGGPDKVPALSATWREEKHTPFEDKRGRGVQTTIRTMHLFGGVDLTVKPTINGADARTKELSRAVAEALARASGKEHFTVDFGGDTLFAKVLDIGRKQPLARR